MSHQASSVVLTQSYGLGGSRSWLCSRPNGWTQNKLHIPSGSSLHFVRSALKIFWWNILGFMSIYFLIKSFYTAIFSLLSTVKFPQSPFVVFMQFVPTYLIHLTDSVWRLSKNSFARKNDQKKLGVTFTNILLLRSE